ncbi:hypothetical protein ABGT15_01885 [Flavobacterium enshiense]|uniref:hypothetical protein n=1 Tax=Flavobacterium enshiense TaxID=1341165 RepID=UPI00345CBC1D
MKKILTILIIGLLLSLTATAQGGGPGGGGPGGGNGGPCDNPPCGGPHAPINNKLELLAVAGLALAGWYFIRFRTKKA